MQESSTLDAESLEQATTQIVTALILSNVGPVMLPTGRETRGTRSTAQWDSQEEAGPRIFGVMLPVVGI